MPRGAPMFELNAPDRRSLALHEAIVAKLRRHPELFERVQACMPAYVRRCEEIGSGPYARRWAVVVDQGLEATLAMALAEGEDGQVMRSCTPLTGILTQEERLAVLQAAWRAHPV